MAKDIEMKVRIGAELTQIKNALKTVQSDLDRLGKSGKRAGAEAGKGTDLLTKSINRATTAVSGFLTVYAAINALRGIVAIADEFSQINARLKLVTNSTEEYQRAQRELFSIAQETRSELGSTINLYERIARSTKDLNVSQDELLQVTQTINQAVQLSGASAEAADAALIQLGQGLASGTLRGEELNSVLEQTPRLAQAIAQGLGVTTGELRKLGADGLITGEQVLNALLTQADVVQGEFSTLPRTVGQSLTQLRNEFKLVISETDMSPLIDSIDELRATLSDPATQAGLVSFASALVTVANAVASATAATVNFVQLIGEELAVAIGGIADDDLVRLGNRLVELQRELRYFEEQGDKLGGLFDFVYDGQIQDLKGEISELQKRFAAAAQSALELSRNQPAGGSAEDKAGRFKAEAEARVEAARAAALQAEQEKQLAKEAERNQKNIDNLIAGLREQAETFGMNADQVIRYRLAVMGASLEEQDRAAALVLTIEQLKALEEAEEAAVEAAQKAAEERRKVEEELAKELADIRIRILEATGRGVEARAASLAAEFDPLIAKLKAKGDEAGVALVESLINTELANARLSEFERKISEATDRVRQTEESVENRVAIGDTSAAEGQDELTLARSQAIADLQAVKEEIQALGAESPEAAQAISEIDQQIANLAGQNVSGAEAALRRLRTEVGQIEKNFAGGAIDVAADSLSGALVDIATGAKSASDAFRDMARAFLSSLAQMAADALAKRAILALVGGFTGGATAAVAHTGGVIGRSVGTKRVVSSALFGNAPRYHSGGMAGLAPGEVPAILQTGEEVLTRDDPRHSLNGGAQGGGGNVRIINTIDPALVEDFMASAAGERTILNVIQRNPGAVKQAVS